MAKVRITVTIAAVRVTTTTTSTTATTTTTITFHPAHSLGFLQYCYGLKIRRNPQDFNPTLGRFNQLPPISNQLAGSTRRL